MQALFDLPFIVMMLVVVATVWRVFACCATLSAAKTAAQMRYAVWSHFSGLLLDIFIIPLFLVLAISWRGPEARLAFCFPFLCF